MATTDRDRSQSPLRSIVAVERDERGVLVDRLECNHTMTHDAYANRQGRRRCPACRLGRKPEPPEWGHGPASLGPVAP